MKLITNHFRVKSKASTVVMYDVEIKGQAPPRADAPTNRPTFPPEVNHAVMRSLAEARHWVYAFDGMKILYAPVPLRADGRREVDEEGATFEVAAPRACPHPPL